MENSPRLPRRPRLAPFRPPSTAGPPAAGVPAPVILALLSAVYGLNVLDRSIFGVLLPLIKSDLQLTDTAIGFMSGAGFAVFYTTLGFPIARVADRSSRKWVITLSLAAFSLMTVVCGLVRTGGQLLGARIGVAVGEAGTNPSSFAMIGDRYPVSRRSYAMAVLSAGANIGVLVGFIVGGFIAARYGWRVAFAAVGLPGVLLAFATALLLPDSPRPSLTAQASKPPSFLETLRALWRSKAFKRLALGNGCALFISNGVTVWLPSLLARSFHVPTQQVSLFMGLAIGLGGLAGTLVLGGAFVDWLHKRDGRWPAWFIAVTTLSTSLFLLPVLLAPTGEVALTFYLAPAALNLIFQPPALAMVQALVPSSMRATANAVLLFVSNMIGIGLGPLTIGVLSDLYAAHGLEQATALRSAFLTVLPVGALGGFSFLLASFAHGRESEAVRGL